MCEKRWKQIAYCLIAVLFAGICMGKMKFDAYATDTAVVGDANVNLENADLNNDGEITIKDLEHCREFLVKGYSVVTGTYAYNSGTYENGTLTNKNDKVTVKLGDIHADVSRDGHSFEATVANGTHDMIMRSDYFRDVTVSSVEVNGETTVEKTTFTVPWMRSGNYEYSETSGYAIYNGAAKTPVGMTAEGGFTTTATMRPYSAGRYRGNIGVSVDGNTFYIIPYRDKPTGEILIYVSEQIINEWDYANAAKGVGGTGQILASTDTANKCTLKLTYLNGNYYVSVQIPGTNTTSSAVVLNAQSTGLDEKYFASGARKVQFCGFKTMVAYYTDISYQIGDEAAKAALASVEEYAIPTLNITENNKDVNTGIVANEGFVMSYNVTRYSTSNPWDPAGVYFAYSESEKNFFAVDNNDSDVKYIICKKWGQLNALAKLPENSNFKRGDTITIVYLNQKYYVILNGQTKVLDSTASFTYPEGLGSNLFTEHPRTIGFVTTSATTAQFSNVKISLGDAAAEEMLCNVGYAAKVTGSYAYNSGTYENGVLTNKDDVVTVKIGDTVANINREAQTFEAVVPKGTYDVTLSSSYFRDVTVSSVEVNEATNVETAFTVPKMPPNYHSYSESSGYGVYKEVSKVLVGMTAGGGFTTTATMKPSDDCRYRGNIGVSVGENIFRIIPYRDPSGEILIYVSEQIIDEWDYNKATGIAAKRVGGTGQILADPGKANKCTLKLTYLNGNYYVSVQIPGTNTTSPAVVLNAQSTGLDEKYFASGTRRVRFCGFKTMMAYYTDISYQIGDEAAENAMASVTEFSIPKLKIDYSTDVNTGIIAKEGFVMSYKINDYTSSNTWNPAGVYFAYSADEKTLVAVGDRKNTTSGNMRGILCKKVGTTGDNILTNPNGDYGHGEMIQIVYYNNVYYFILDGKVAKLEKYADFTNKWGTIGAHFFTSDPRTIGFMTSSATKTTFNNITISLGNDAAQSALTAAGVTY